MPEARRALKSEALPLRQLVLRDRKILHCSICKDTAVRKKRTRRRAVVPEFHSIGGMLAMGHVNDNALIHIGLGGECEVLAVSDLATDILGAFPVACKTAERVLSSLVMDCAPEPIAPVSPPHRCAWDSPDERDCRGSLGSSDTQDAVAVASGRPTSLLISFLRRKLTPHSITLQMARCRLAPSRMGTLSRGR